MSISGAISEFRTDTDIDKGVIVLNTSENRNQRIAYCSDEKCRNELEALCGQVQKKLVEPLIKADYMKQPGFETEQLLLRFVTEDDQTEVARTWPSDHHPLTHAEAREAIAYMRENYGRNTKGCVCHLCLAVCGKDHPGTIMGWCGLDGTRNHAKPEIFILLDEEYRNRGYGTQCVKELLRIAVEDYALSGVHGGCTKENIASARAMEKGGMVQYGTEENGDPLFRFTAKEKAGR